MPRRAHAHTYKWNATELQKVLHKKALQLDTNSAFFIVREKNVVNFESQNEYFLAFDYLYYVCSTGDNVYVI